MGKNSNFSDTATSRYSLALYELAEENSSLKEVEDQSLALSKLINKNKDYLIAILGAMVGSLAYTFSDSFWFSAVEGEVYALSSFFTALVFWSIIKWSMESFSY